MINEIKNLCIITLKQLLIIIPSDSLNLWLILCFSKILNNKKYLSFTLNLPLHLKNFTLRWCYASSSITPSWFLWFYITHLPNVFFVAKSQNLCTRSSFNHFLWSFIESWRENLTWYILSIIIHLYQSLPRNNIGLILWRISIQNWWVKAWVVGTCHLIANCCSWSFMGTPSIHHWFDIMDLFRSKGKIRILWIERWSWRLFHFYSFLNRIFYYIPGISYWTRISHCVGITGYSVSGVNHIKWSFFWDPNILVISNEGSKKGIVATSVTIFSINKCHGIISSDIK